MTDPSHKDVVFFEYEEGSTPVQSVGSTTFKYDDLNPEFRFVNVCPHDDCYGTLGLYSAEQCRELAAALERIAEWF